MPDYGDFLDLQKRQAKPTEDLAAHRAMQQTVVLRLEQLLQADEWGTYTAHVEALVTRDQATVDVMREQIEAGALVGDDLARVNLRLQRILGRVDAYRDVLALPREIINRSGTPEAKP